VLDPLTFTPTADFDTWDSLSTGIDHVLVGGQLTIFEQQYTGALAGRVLLRQNKPQVKTSGKRPR